LADCIIKGGKKVAVFAGAKWKYASLLSPATDVIKRMFDALLSSAVCDERHVHAAINAVRKIQTKHVTQ
jgi:precorrin isomerase